MVNGGGAKGTETLVMASLLICRREGGASQLLGFPSSGEVGLEAGGRLVTAVVASELVLIRGVAGECK